MSQATVTKHIQTLEKELHTQLISREHRQISLTDTGKLALPLLQHMLADEQQLLNQLRQVNGHQPLRIRAIPTISHYQAFNLIPTFQKHHPDISLTFSEGENQSLLDALDQETTDIAFLRFFNQLPSRYESILCAEDHFVVVLPKSHPLSQQPKINMAALKDDNFLLLDEMTQLYDPILTLAQQAGFTPKVSYKGKRIDLILDMINRHMGISIMMAKSVDLNDFPTIVTRPLETTIASRLAFVKLKKHHTTVSDCFWQFCQKHQPQI